MYSLLELNIKVWSCLYFKIERIKKKSTLSLSCILYTYIFQKFPWRGIWFGFPLFWQQLFKSWRFQALLSSVCFRVLGHYRPSVLQNHWILLSDKTDLLVKKEISILPKHQDSLPSKHRLLLCPGLWQLSRNICLLYITSPKKNKISFLFISWSFLLRVSKLDFRL